MGPWARRREVACGVLRFSPKPEKGLFFAVGDGSRFFVVCFLHTSGHMLWYQTPGRRPPRITGRGVNTVIRGWVGGPNEVPRSEFITQSLVLSIDGCQGLGISPLQSKHLAEFFSGSSWPTSGLDIFFVFFLESLGLFYEDLSS